MCALEWVKLTISIHALREEGDPVSRNTNGSISLFLSTPSARRATECIVDIDSTTEFLSTPSARRATGGLFFDRDLFQISIHALREEGDHDGPGSIAEHSISIHALREEGDLTRNCNPLTTIGFLSTPSARRATRLR